MVSNRTGIPLQVMHFNQQMQQTFDDQAGGATHPHGSGSRHLDIPAGETCGHHTFAHTTGPGLSLLPLTGLAVSSGSATLGSTA